MTEQQSKQSAEQEGPASSTPDFSSPGLRDWPTHSVRRLTPAGPEFALCFCWANEDHQVGAEVLTWADELLCPHGHHSPDTCGLCTGVDG